MKTELTLHDRTLTLHRYPRSSNDTLQAWDAGDEYLINHVSELNLPAGSHILILNDNFGALSCWFSLQYQVSMMSDSFIAHQATQINLEQNHCPAVTLQRTLDVIPDHVDLVLMQIPRNNRHLVWQLAQLRSTLPANCPVIAVNKAKEIHSSTLRLFEKYLGQTSTSLAWKKHRLVFSMPDSSELSDLSSDTRWQIDDYQIELNNLPNVYSGESLDQGARFLLSHLPVDEQLRHIVDLGCGNGVLSVRMGQLNPQARITCVDESFMAIESARQNLVHNLGAQQSFECVANNCLEEFAAATADMVVCNPPFHQQQTITDHIAWQMFCDSKHVLRKGGKLLVIGNRHLGYDVKLTRLFGRSQVKTVASNKKFVILQAIKL